MPVCFNDLEWGTMEKEKSQKFVAGQASPPSKSNEKKELVGQASVPVTHSEEISIYRRKLPHWTQSGAVYFVTWRLHLGQPELSPEERTVVASALEHFRNQRYELFAYVVMNDHVHGLVKPIDENSLQSILHSWKSFTAHRLQRQFGRQGAVWQDEYFDRIVRDDAEFFEKAQYILNNPRKRWNEIEEYRWVRFFYDASDK